MIMISRITRERGERHNDRGVHGELSKQNHVHQDNETGKPQTQETTKTGVIKLTICHKLGRNHFFVLNVPGECRKLVL